MRISMKCKRYYTKPKLLIKQSNSKNHNIYPAKVMFFVVNFIWKANNPHQILSNNS